jgi:hypothetical protein
MADLLPNLKPLKGAYAPSWQLITDCRIFTNDPDTEEQNRTTIRFSNGVANIGNGPLELIRKDEQVQEDGDKVATAIQRIYQDDGSFREHNVGQFAFHAAEHHNHWHYEGFASFELLSEDGKTVVKSKKEAFCLLDALHITRRLGGPDSPYYLQDVCKETPVSGISVGWADIYARNLPGQFIDITDVQSGIYWLKTTSNPDLLLQTIDGSSFEQAKIRIDKEQERVFLL